jgi:hypothetical protein
VVVLNQQPAPRGARRDDLIAFPSASHPLNALFAPIQVPLASSSWP